MRLEIAKLHGDLGATMIYVTHDQVEAMTLADKIVVLRSGKIEQVGEPMDLYNNPANIFVAGFIGSPKMNFIRAELAGVSNTVLSLRLPDYDNVSVTFPANGAAFQRGEELLLGIRPEHFSAEGQVKLQVEAEVVENLGTASYAYSRSASKHPLIIEIRDTSGIKPRSMLSMGFNTDRAFLFDPKSGLRVH